MSSEAIWSSSLKEKEMDQNQNQTLFSSGLDLANLAVTSGLLDHAWKSISELKTDARSINIFPVKVNASQPSPDLTLLTITVLPTLDHCQDGEEMVSSESLKEPSFEFLCTREEAPKAEGGGVKTRWASIDKVAISFYTTVVHNELLRLKDKYPNSHIGKPAENTSPSQLIITGHSLGGSIASLFTLWLISKIDPLSTKYPLCVTFGSRFLGDDVLREVIAKSSTWSSSFLHVASVKGGPAPKFDMSSQAQITPLLYKPFGTFLLCSESGCACFETEIERVLKLLEALGNRSDSGNQQLLEVDDYGILILRLKEKLCVRKVTEFAERIKEPLPAGIATELQATGIAELQDVDVRAVIESIEKQDRISARRNKMVAVASGTKKLNHIKTRMADLEWYKKVSMFENIGYYDSYKNGRSQKDGRVTSLKKELKIYWTKIVQEVEKMLQKEGAAFRIRWIFAGTNYRRMVEPLDIAEFYKDNNSQGISYLKCRDKHYKLLEKWHNIEEKKKDQKYNRTKFIGMTEDSCFWAHLEDAIESCRLLNDGELQQAEKLAEEERLEEFENYFMGLLENLAVSPEVFLRGSSLMKWWSQYEKFIRSRSSLLADYMKKREYLQYVEANDKKYFM